jgi:hypothetical protein
LSAILAQIPLARVRGDLPSGVSVALIAGLQLLTVLLLARDYPIIGSVRQLVRQPNVREIFLAGVLLVCQVLDHSAYVAGAIAVVWTAAVVAVVGVYRSRGQHDHSFANMVWIVLFRFYVPFLAITTLALFGIETFIL